ncbi:MAG TPA: ATP-binding protein [Gemmataceae bacterium]|nr:ATP-binding protein [Gemmataceae bacterium]
MSYRAFKRLLGETSLERKCRFLFGAFILLLITSSFWLYAWQTEQLAFDQLTATCRLLVVQIMQRQLTTGCHPLDAHNQPADEDKKAAETLIDDFRKDWGRNLPGGLDDYHASKITRNTKPEQMPSDNYTLQRLNEFLADRDKLDDNRLLLSDGPYLYYAAVRAGESCLECHRELQRRTNPELPEMKAKDLIALVKIEVPKKAIESIEDRMHVNRAVLISTALVTALLIMTGSWLIVRYVIVKPVKHLKEVSDAISAGELNVRSEIQTGDEFEDLSHAFNRMLRNLVAMQDRLRKVNADLDRKVDELAQANLALYESNRLKGDFLATMSHELRTPLNSILGFSEVLQSADGLSDKQTRWVGNIRTSGEQLLALINDILDLAKIEAGKMQVRVSEFSVYDICEGLLTMFRPMAEKKNIELRAALAPDAPLLHQDVVKLQQILSNLLSNAVKFTPEGGRVLLKAEADATHIVLTVSDTGVGIAAEEQELVFEKFRQGGSALTREHAGTGLGLSIVRELVKLLGGEVTLQSELGRGSTFTVRLPLQRSEEPRLEFDLAHEGIDLSKAQRVDGRLYGAGQRPNGEPGASAPGGTAPSLEPSSGG